MNRANYIIVAESRKALIIQDIGPWDRYPSVTNDAEDVVRELVGRGFLPEGRRLFYCDSDGQLDEILVKDGQFVGFAPWPGPSTAEEKKSHEL